MEITVKCFATLSEYQPDNADRFPIEERNTVQDVLERLNISPKEVKLVFVNGKKAPLTQEIKNGDRIGIFPAVGGG
jgi:sulfur carrier protein ThiS